MHTGPGQIHDLPKGAEHSERVELDLITGVRGQSPQRGPGTEIWWRGKPPPPPEAENLSSIFIQKRPKV